MLQVLTQFPDAFEFNTKYLVRIAEHLNSGWYGSQYFFEFTTWLENFTILYFNNFYSFYYFTGAPEEFYTDNS